MIYRASHLFGDHQGEHLCFLCAHPCGELHPRDTVIKEGFTNQDEAANLNSQWVCSGCAESRSESADVQLIDGELRKSQKRRLYSWILTPTKQVAATKAHLSLITKWLLSPPGPPFAVCLADSGQKHLCWRTPSATDRDRFPVALEESIIEVEVEKLKYYMACLQPLIAAVGKPPLYSGGEAQIAVGLSDLLGSNGVHHCEWWQQHKQIPLVRLAHWLSPNKEACQHAIGITKPTRVPAQTSWTF